jgi:hypothetical protein
MLGSLHETVATTPDGGVDAVLQPAKNVAAITKRSDGMIFIFV